MQESRKGVAISYISFFEVHGAKIFKKMRKNVTKTRFSLHISKIFCNFAAANVKTRMKAWGSIWDMKHKS